jgi:hypothetical protein
MSNHAQQPSSKDPSAQGGDKSRGTQPAGVEAKPTLQTGGAQSDAQMQEAIDRATAAVGQDDGKR